jgi:hypothetical protein
MRSTGRASVPPSRPGLLLRPSPVAPPAQARAAAMNGYNDEQLTVMLTLVDRLHEITQVEIARPRDT